MIKQVNKNNKTSNMNILHIVQEIIVKHVHDEKYGKQKRITSDFQRCKFQCLR